MSNKENDKYVFGLDIGTRSVVGTVGYFEDDRFKVVCQRSIEHETRSMIDGQIHDIPRVATTIKEVKEQCEAVIGEPLNRVCIAAAGRVLKTVNTHVDMIFEEERETKPEDVTNLQLLGVEKAYKEFQSGNNTDIKFYCVGYSVIKYYIDKLPILNLVGHKAKHISADMIATFLPDDVVDGLYKAVDFAGLEVLNLTLEPIAAMSVAIPERFRMLNLALVDVGAGTSDISITDAGSIIGYGMIPMAGDSLTDELARHYLADFYQAEKIKRGATNQDTIEYEDIMGIKQTITSDDAAQAMAGKIDEMTTYVSDEIKRLNGDKPVSAVFVVGGGGLAKGYTDALADKLGLMHERVALRGSDVLGKIDFEEEDLSKSPLMVTPIGICLNYYENNNNLIYTFFNGTRMKLYDNGHVAVVDVAMQAGFPNDGLFPKRGKALSFSVNGKSKIIKGELGEAAMITVNGEPADITTKVSSNDRVVIIESTAGMKAKAKISDLPEFKEGLKLLVDGQIVEFTRPVFANGQSVTPSYEICEGDHIEVLDTCTKEQLMDVLGTDDAKKVETVDVSKADVKPTESDVIAKEKQKGATIAVTVNKSPVTLTGKYYYIFIDVFDYIDFDLNDPKGKSIVTLHNGENAKYMEPLNDGDFLEIYWKD
ncbi:MAG: cell division protein FtsA [Lachnospiraceae bacterium]|nr:cell division protein FtsA [Lachnospiraceae bacterium]